MLHTAGLFHLEVMPYILGRAVQQHCLAEGAMYEAYRRGLFPPVTRLFQPKLLEPIHVAWVPTTHFKNAPVTHIVPVKPKHCGPLNISIDVCGATAVGRCLNAMQVCDELDWVECSQCKQWYHCDCVGVTISSVSRRKWFCGCGQSDKIK